MPAIQSLKKQLKGIQSTQKLTKAMKTVSTVKFSKLNTVYNEFLEYSKSCKAVFENFKEAFLKTVEIKNPTAPSLVIVLASNKGMCGSYNSEVLNFAIKKLKEIKSFSLIVCGKKGINFFNSRGIVIDKEVVFEDLPDYAQTAMLFDEIIQLRKQGSVSNIYIVYSKYNNMMLQTPTMCDFFDFKENTSENNMPLFIPDKKTIIKNVANTVFKAMFYEFVLEVSIGVQASMLMTMRSAYDTASEYVEDLEKNINRIRQGAVTADVIETSVERED